jgi:hypothetical protein
MKPRCTAKVLWWDTLHNARCVRPAGHDDYHRDGVAWFDNNGMQVDGAQRLAAPNAEPSAA